MVEKEYKYLVEKERFYSLLDRVKLLYPLADVQEKIQVNYYYDTDTFELHKQNITFRIRQTENTLKLETKHHLCKPNQYQTSLENACDLPNFALGLCATSWLNMGLDPSQQYKLQGSLTTHRTSIFLSDGLKIEFDKNFYFGICDYEIEMEFDANSARTAKMLADNMHFLKPNTQGKSTRFFTEKERLHRGTTV